MCLSLICIWHESALHATGICPSSPPRCLAEVQQGLWQWTVVTLGPDEKIRLAESLLSLAAIEWAQKQENAAGTRRECCRSFPPHSLSNVLVQSAQLNAIASRPGHARHGVACQALLVSARCQVTRSHGKARALHYRCHTVTRTRRSPGSAVDGIWVESVGRTLAPQAARNFSSTDSAHFPDGAHTMHRLCSSSSATKGLGRICQQSPHILLAGDMMEPICRRSVDEVVRSSIFLQIRLMSDTAEGELPGGPIRGSSTLERALSTGHWPQPSGSTTSPCKLTYP